MRWLTRSLLPGLGIVLAACVENALWGHTGTSWWVAVPLAVALGAAMALRRTVPLVAVGVAVAGGLVVNAFTAGGGGSPVPLTSLLVLAVVGYRAGRYAPGRRATIAFLVTLAAGAVAALGVVRGPGNWLFFVGVSEGMFLLLPWLIGRYRAQERTLLRAGWDRAAQLEREQHMVAEQARLRERTRIAEDMHDSLGHELSLIALRAGLLELATDLPPAHRTAVGELRRSVSVAGERLSDILGVLRDDDAPPPTEPVHAAVTDLVTRARASGMAVTLRAGDHARPSMVDLAVHRIVQESLTNAAKHAPGAPVTVDITDTEADTVVQVRNGPPPEDRPAPPGTGGRGLIGLSERVRVVGGTLSTERSDHGAFTLTARLPHPATPEEPR